MTTYNTQPLPFPAVNNSWDSLSVDQVLADIPVAHANVENGPPTATGADAKLYWDVRYVQSGLFVAAHKKGATQAQIQAALGK